MGERIATQILYQNMQTSPEKASMRYIDFDGRLVKLSASPYRDIRFPDAIETDAGIDIVDPTTMSALSASDWWRENIAVPAVGV